MPVLRTVLAVPHQAIAPSSLGAPVKRIGQSGESLGI